MRVRFAYLALVLAGSCAQAQNPAPAQSVSTDLRPHNYVRRVSLGVTLSVTPLTLIPNNSADIISTSPISDSLYTTQDITHRIGYGLTAQVALTSRFAVNGRLLVRKMGYTMNSDIIQGQDNPSTAADERTFIVRNEDTRARVYELPVTVRYFGKDRTEKGARWFIEGGGALRRVSHIKSSRNSTINSSATQCCDTTPEVPSHETIRGGVAGVGVQLIDPFGIRVIPEFRYTRWFGANFSSFSTSTRRNQLEAVLTISF